MPSTEVTDNPTDDPVENETSENGTVDDDEPVVVTDDVDDPDDVDDVDDVDERAVAERGPRHASRAPLRIAVAAAIVFGLLAVVLAAVAVSERNHHGGDADRTAVSTTAAQVSQAIVTVSPGDNKQSSDIIRSLATAPVAQQYDETASAIQKTMQPLNVTGYKGDIKAVYVGDVDTDQAKVIVVLDLIVLADTPKVVPNHYLDVHLSKIDGAWKVDNLQDINLALAAGGTSAGAVGGPSTTVPAPSSTPSSTEPPSTSSASG